MYAYIDNAIRLILIQLVIIKLNTNTWCLVFILIALLTNAINHYNVIVDMFNHQMKLINIKMSYSCKRHLHKTAVLNTKPVSDLFTNPVDRLQPFLQIPIIPESDYAFRPSRNEMEEASLMFQPQNMKGERFKFLGSYPNPHIMPQWNIPEVAFIGKSNVGKSSLLAAMFAQVPDVIVRVSQKPGSTKLMNVFNVNNKFHLVDMPGYGFNMPDHYEISVEAYLKSRRSLTRVIMLIDATTGPVDVDYIAIDMMEEVGTPYVIILTKIDLASQSTLLRNVVSVLKFREETKANSCFPQPFLVSSINGEGLAFLQAFIAYITGNLKVQTLN
ncbi:GTP-binding protein [Bulinus truncatus]|nr:GTP-binding protein [Bulinus truncatus]